MTTMATGKFDQRISFQASDSRAADAWKKRHTNPVVAAEDDGTHACAQKEWCHAATRGADGTWQPARTFQPFCPSCRGRIAHCLSEIPFACVRLLVASRERPRTGKAVRVPPGPREQVRVEVSALVQQMAFVLGSWHERVARTAALVMPDMDAAVHHPEFAVRDAVRALYPDRVDALLALPLEPMARVMFSPQAAEEWLAVIDPQEEGRVRPSGEAHMAPSLSGINAGKEILELHHRARRILGEVPAQAEPFDGVPCRECEDIALERAEPPSDPSVPAAHSRCAKCGHMMSKDEYDGWAKWYATWAEAVPGLTCRRCEKGLHEQCKWGACECRAAGHAT